MADLYLYRVELTEDQMSMVEQSLKRSFEQHIKETGDIAYTLTFEQQDESLEKANVLSGLVKKFITKDV